MISSLEKAKEEADEAVAEISVKLVVLQDKFRRCVRRVSLKCLIITLKFY